MPQKLTLATTTKSSKLWPVSDEFESRASNAFMKGDQNDGRVTGEIERVGEDTPMAVREVDELDQRISQIERPTLMYHRPNSEEYETIAQTLDYLHNNIEGLKKTL